MGDMMIYGVGIDLVENDRLEKIIEKWGMKFLIKVFSEREIQYCGKHAKSATHYGARFAAKESFLKALGLGLGMGVNLRDIEVVNDDSGRPSLTLAGGAKDQIERRNITDIHLSLTHTRKYATALVVLEKNI